MVFLCDSAMSEDASKPNRNKRKRKKTFLKNARKYAKQGYYGRGNQLDADTYQYFVRIMEAYREGFDNDEDKSVFVNNVFEQTENEEINHSCNQVGCRVIEMLLPFANNTVLERFLTAFCADLRPLCNDRFASHVIEALLKESHTRSLNSDEDSVKFKTFTLKISKFLLNNLEDYIWDTYANHIIRTVLENLARIPKEDKTNNHKNIINKIENVEEIPEEYLEIIKDYGQRLITWPQLKDMPYTEITSGFLQVLLKALAKIDRKLLKKYLNKLNDESFSPESENEVAENSTKWPQVFMSKPAMMLLEVALQVAAPKAFIQMYAKCFVGKLSPLAKTRSTNFAVQKLLTHCMEKKEFDAMFDELSGTFEVIIEAQHTGVILALAQTCKRLSTKQGSFVQKLMKAVHCSEPEERQNAFIPCLCKFTTYENIQKMEINNLEKEKLNLHGTLILQTLLEFNKPIKIINGILSMESDEIKSLFCNTMGSHIVDSYVKSQFVGEKSREKLIRKLQGTYQELAASKYGSRSFEAIWNVCHLKFRMSIMEELTYKDGLWSNTEHGRIIAAKVNLSLYKRNKEEWKQSLSKAIKVKELTDMLK